MKRKKLDQRRLLAEYLESCGPGQEKAKCCLCNYFQSILWGPLSFATTTLACYQAV